MLTAWAAHGGSGLIGNDKPLLHLLLYTDHYGGLSDNWSGGLIYCSEVTARLVHLLTGVPMDLLRPVPMDVTLTVHGAQDRFASPQEPWLLPLCSCVLPLLASQHCNRSCLALVGHSKALVPVTQSSA